MNKFIKISAVVLALSAVAPAFAEEEEEGAVGWTPIAFGIASPVQLPWGMARWDVFGLDLNALYSDAPKMYGLGIGGVAMTTRDMLKGWQISGLCNWNSKDVYGIRTTIGANISFANEYAWDTGMFAYREGDMWGIDIEFIGCYQKNFWGLQCAGLVNFTAEQTYGCEIAIGGNIAHMMYGCAVGGVFNFTDELHGCQIGLVNYARECPWGFQIGIINIILDNKIKVLPIVNAYF